MDITKIQNNIAKGWVPNEYLTNMSIAYLQQTSDFVASRIFPMIPVQKSIGSYYIFNRGDLARDNVSRKPQFGKTQPMVISSTTDTYRCVVDQIIVGIDQIDETNYERDNTPGMADPRKAKVITATEQIYTHLDRIWAESFFKTGIWDNELTGVASSPTTGQFLKFTDANCNPIQLFDTQRDEMKRRGRRKANKLALGAEAWIGLKNNPFILDRVIGTGSSNNPAIVTEKAVAEILGFEEVVVCQSTYNAAKVGAEENMQYICDSKGALMVYAPNSPGIDEPSAGYIFGWDMLKDGHTIAFDQWEGEKGTHSEFVEGLCATDMKITSQELGTYLSACV